jgi:hypothetical protein
LKPELRKMGRAAPGGFGSKETGVEERVHWASVLSPAESSRKKETAVTQFRTNLRPFAARSVTNTL